MVAGLVIPRGITPDSVVNYVNLARIEWVSIFWKGEVIRIAHVLA